MNTIYLLSKQQTLQTKIQEIEKELSSLPTGNIYCVHYKNRVKWYHNNGSGPVYLKKTDYDLKQKLASRKYLKELHNQYRKELKALTTYLAQHIENTDAAGEELLNNPDYHPLITTSFKTLSQEISEWQHQSYKSNAKSPECLTYQTESGIYVRSKSEAIIVMLLEKHKIPYRYECALKLNDTTIYPDFTIRHPKTGKIYYYEHFGLMDNPEYMQKALAKIQLYENNGIMPGTQLIISFESEQVPFNPTTIENMLKHYFLE